MNEPELDLSGFQAERKVDVPPPPKKKGPSTPKPKSATKKGKKGKKKKKTATVKDSGRSEKGPKPRPKPERKSPQPGKHLDTPARKPGRKKRVNVSLPVDLSQRFTQKASEEDRYLTDMVLDAYRDHFAAMLDAYLAERGDGDLPFRPRRRKTATGRVTHMLYLAAPEVAVLDGSAEEIGLSRSELVSQLLERELG